MSRGTWRVFLKTKAAWQMAGSVTRLSGHQHGLGERLDHASPGPPGAQEPDTSSWSGGQDGKEHPQAVHASAPGSWQAAEEPSMG